MIDGGANGAIAFIIGALIGQLITMVILSKGALVTSISSSFLAPAILLALGTFMLMFGAYLYYIQNKEDDTELKCFHKGIGAGIAVRGLIGAQFTRKILALLGLANGAYLSQECF